MVKQDLFLHKMLVIALLLAVFVVPFYVVRHRLGAFQTNVDSYMVDVAHGNNSLTEPKDQAMQPSDTQTAWSMAAGDSFIGSQVK